MVVSCFVLNLKQIIFVSSFFDVFFTSPGELERWHLSAKQYNNKYNRDYWTDLLEVSSALGVSATLGDATAVVNLVCGVY